MKFKFLLIALVCCFIAGAQTPVQPEPLHEILIFKWAKNKDSVSYEIAVTIDVNGKVKVAKRDEAGKQIVVESKKSFNTKNLQKSFFDFINAQEIGKTDSGFLRAATEPIPGKQVLHITIVTKKDYEKGAGKEDYFPDEYFTLIEADYNDHAPAALFKVLSKKDAALLQKLLYSGE